MRICFDAPQSQMQSQAASWINLAGDTVTRRPKRIPGVMGAAVMVVILAGCSQHVTSGTDIACQAFGPISWSRHDTPPTQRQIVSHNAAWTATCP